MNLYSALLAARHVLGADVTIVAIGPGIPGTATPFGHSGIAQGQALNAAHSLGGAADRRAASVVCRSRVPGMSR